MGADSLWIGESASLFPPWGVFAHPQRIEISLSMSLSTRKMLQVAPTDLLYRIFFALLLFCYHADSVATLHVLLSCQPALQPLRGDQGLGIHYLPLVQR